jgi:hypothetical protein
MVSVFIDSASCCRSPRRASPPATTWQGWQKTGDILGNLSSILMAQVTPEARCHSLMVLSIRLSFAGFDGFTEDLTVGSAPLRASGLRFRHPTDNHGPLRHSHPRRPHPKDHRQVVSYPGTSAPSIVNLWLFPALRPLADQRGRVVGSSARRGQIPAPPCAETCFGAHSAKSRC